MHSTAVEGRFTEGNPATGTPATVVTDDWLNGIQEELAYVITQAELTLNGEDLTQLRQAIAIMIAAGIPDLTALLAHLTDTSDPHATGPALLAAPHAWAQAQTYAPTVLPITSGAVVWDVQADPVAVIVLTEDITGLTVNNAVIGASYELTLIQDGTGGRTMSWPAAWLWPGGTAPEISTAPLAEDVVHLTTRSAGGDAVAVRATCGQEFKVVS
ncbi:MAG: hypothetical protein V3573_06680 [Desulfovibrionaceae bacterium]